MRVLLIEDDSAVARSIELMLKAAGFNIYTTDLGEEGVDLGKVYEYDMIVLDLSLPDISGYEVLKQLRMGRVNTPVMILSGNSLDHATLALAAMHVGVPYAPISPAYSLVSRDFAKLQGIAADLTPGVVDQQERRLARAHRDDDELALRHPDVDDVGGALGVALDADRADGRLLAHLERQLAVLLRVTRRSTAAGRGACRVGPGRRLRAQPSLRREGGLDRTATRLDSARP